MSLLLQYTPGLVSNCMLSSQFYDTLILQYTSPISQLLSYALLVPEDTLWTDVRPRTGPATVKSARESYRGNLGFS